MNMQKIVTKFAERKPRLYGFLILTSAVVLILLVHHFLPSRIASNWIFLPTGMGVIGVCYLAFGLRAHRWFAEPSNRDMLYCKHMHLFASLGVLVYILASFLDWMLSR